MTRLYGWGTPKVKLYLRSVTIVFYQKKQMFQTFQVVITSIKRVRVVELNNNNNYLTFKLTIILFLTLTISTELNLLWHRFFIVIYAKLWQLFNAFWKSLFNVLFYKHFVLFFCSLFSFRFFNCLLLFALQK